MKQEQKSTKQIPHALSILVLLSVCIFSNIVSILYQHGVFHSWKSLAKPSSPAVQIINANPDSIWVKSADGNIYVATVRSIVTAPVPCVAGDTCPRWILVQNANEIHPPFAEYTVRKTSCENFDGQFPRNPSGTVVECVKTTLPATLEGNAFDSYFALMLDGTIKYWTKYNGVYFSPIANTPIINAVIASFVWPIIALFIATILYPKLHAKAG